MKKAAPIIHDIVRHPAAHVSPRTGSASKTLMRQSVKKPAPNLKLKVQGPADLGAPRIVGGEPLPRLELNRFKHAQRVPKSQLISHFSPVAASPAPLPAAAPAPSFSSVQAPVAAPTRSAKKQPKTTADLLDQVLQQANSHEPLPPKTRHKRRTKRRTGIGVGVALAAVLIVVVASQNLSNVRLQVASAKAGFSARLPDYQPSGFSQGALNYSSGVVASRFVSNSDSRSYTITQKVSSWNSTQLRDNFVAPSNPQYQTVQTTNSTIYLYGQGNATWVKGGVWYVVQSSGALSDHQLIQIASSF